MSSAMLSLASKVCFIAGFVSILLSIAIWFFLQGSDPAFGQRMAIFVGLWPPTFFSLSDRLDRFISRRG